MKLHPGYAVAMVGYIVAIFVMAVTPPEGGALLAVMIQIFLFAGLAACTLLCLTDGKWQQSVSWRLYALVMAVSGGCAGLGEWYAVATGHTGSFADFLVSSAGIVGLLVVHRWAHRQGMV